MEVNLHNERVFARKAAEEKGRDRLALAAMPPEAAQALVTSLPPDGGSWVDVTPEDRWFPPGDPEAAEEA